MINITLAVIYLLCICCGKLWSLLDLLQPWVWVILIMPRIWVYHNLIPGSKSMIELYKMAQAINSVYRNIYIHKGEKLLHEPVILQKEMKKIHMRIVSYFKLLRVYCFHIRMVVNTNIYPWCNIDPPWSSVQYSWSQ